MSQLTPEQIIQAIREADSLADLKKAIGPTQDEKAAAMRRLENMDSLWSSAEKKGWGYDPSRWPYPFNESYLRLSQEQITYENQYF